MKKILILPAFMAIILSCSKQMDNESVESNIVREINVKTLGFSSIDNETKAAISLDGKTFQWTKGDELSVWPLSNDSSQESSQVKFIYNGSESSNSATFCGTGWGLICDGNYEYFSYYPFNHTDTKTQASVNYPDVFVQTENNSTSHLGDYLYMYAPAITPNDPLSVTFTYYQLGCRAKFIITVPDEVQSSSFKSMRVFNSSKPFIQSASYDPSICTSDTKPIITPIKYAESINFNFTSAGIKPTSKQIIAYAVMCPAQLNGKTLTIDIFDNAGNRYSGTCTCTKNQESANSYCYSATVSSNPIEGTKPEFVDLGLSVLWATHNIGASKPSEIGQYYRFGETTPYSNTTYSFDYTDTTYYKTSTSTVFKTLKPDYDIATIKYGSEYRTPTYGELTDLSNVDYEAGYYDGALGMYFYNKEDHNKFIFIPLTSVAGWDWFAYNKLYLRSSQWSVGTVKSYSMSVTFSSPTPTPSGGTVETYYGVCVRAVKDKTE